MLSSHINPISSYLCIVPFRYLVSTLARKVQIFIVTQWPLSFLPSQSTAFCYDFCFLGSRGTKNEVNYFPWRGSMIQCISDVLIGSSRTLYYLISLYFNFSCLMWELIIWNAEVGHVQKPNPWPGSIDWTIYSIFSFLLSPAQTGSHQVFPPWNVRNIFLLFLCIVTSLSIIFPSIYSSIEIYFRITTMAFKSFSLSSTSLLSLAPILPDRFYWNRATW